MELKIVGLLILLVIVISLLVVYRKAIFRESYVPPEPSPWNYVNSNKDLPYGAYPYSPYQASYDFSPYPYHFNKYAYRRYVRPHHSYNFPDRFFRQFGNWYAIV